MSNSSVGPPGTEMSNVSTNSNNSINSSSVYDELASNLKDVSMVDLQREPLTNLHSQSSQQHSESSSDTPPVSSSDGSSQPNSRRRSTLILTDDTDFDKLKALSSDNKDDEMIVDSEQDIGQSPVPERAPTQVPQNPQNSQPPPQPVLVPTVFRWIEGGSKVFVMGTFTGWRKMIALNGPSKKDGSFSVQIALPPGTHRFKFVVDNEVRFSNYIPTATDTSGHFVNYLEIIPSEHEDYTSLNSLTSNNKSKSSLRTLDSKIGLTKDDDDMGDGFTRYHDEDEQPMDTPAEFIDSIPPIFTDPKVMEEYYVTLDNNQRQGNQNQQWLIPPQLPPHLESVILNSYNNTDKDNTSGALSIPNHVVLNHLATTSIKHNTLAVASIVRYKRKYVTQILYAPLQ
ncbi:hypothetical protein OGAPHI_001938 [Ogataea philodendri]|uniref:Association with the SNF1 complex (ASC) domain-containing protein n=1 Tax=Ogataea philodendri TaxID=1378263 RepID=A0A9P8PB13_9ASCO|nr:uncharacterized protein OGAPHI_001938 [Ogataea philodendri]KAH3668184.1 hypothetical protein OGAPHI_001938 [Ogataea philodendri]